MPTLGLFGGSFDPPHLGHFLVAQAALEELSLDRLIFLPAAQSPFKPGTTPAPATARLRMLRQSLVGENRMAVDDMEIRRGGVSFTAESCRAFASRYPGWRLFWLIGADHVPTLPLWREAEQLARIVEFIVIPRPGEPYTTLPAPYRLHSLRGWPLKVSSSEIRDRIKSGLRIHHLVPPAVEEVIACESLYCPPPLR